MPIQRPVLAAALALPALLAACVATARTMNAGTTVYAMPAPMTCAAAQAEALGFRLTRGADSTHFTGAHPEGARLDVRLDVATRQLTASAREPLAADGGLGAPVSMATRVVGQIGRSCGIVSAGPQP